MFISLPISSFLDVFFFQKPTFNFTTLIAFGIGAETGPIAVVRDSSGSLRSATLPELVAWICGKSIATASGFCLFLAVWFSLRCALYFAKRQNRDDFVEVIREIRGQSELTVEIQAQIEQQEVANMIKERVQIGDDKRAQTLVSRITSNNQFDPYSVFLRPFTADGRWTVRLDAVMKIASKTPKYFQDYGLIRGTMTIDSFLAQITKVDPERATAGAMP
jgi:hypothetical protein